MASATSPTPELASSTAFSENNIRHLIRDELRRSLKAAVAPQGVNSESNSLLVDFLSTFTKTFLETHLSTILRDMIMRHIKQVVKETVADILSSSSSAGNGKDGSLESNDGGISEREKKLDALVENLRKEMEELRRKVDGGVAIANWEQNGGPEREAPSRGQQEQQQFNAPSSYPSTIQTPSNMQTPSNLQTPGWSSSSYSNSPLADTTFNAYTSSQGYSPMQQVSPTAQMSGTQNYGQQMPGGDSFRQQTPSPHGTLVQMHHSPTSGQQIPGNNGHDRSTLIGVYSNQVQQTPGNFDSTQLPIRRPTHGAASQTQHPETNGLAAPPPVAPSPVAPSIMTEINAPKRPAEPTPEELERKKRLKLGPEANNMKTLDWLNTSPKCDCGMLVFAGRVSRFAWEELFKDLLH